MRSSLGTVVYNKQPRHGGLGRAERKSQLETNREHSRRLRGRSTRSQSIGTKLTLEEEAEVLAAAESIGKAPSEWAREVMLLAARHARTPEENSALFTEVQAVRLLLINTIEPLLRGEKMTAEQFKELLRYVKNNKRKAAEEVLASYAIGATEE
jgi:hypothetical protein